VTLTWMVVDMDGEQATLPVTVTVQRNIPPSFSLTMVALPHYTIGNQIPMQSLPHATGGNGTLSYDLIPIADLPAGLTLDADALTLDGTPAAAVEAVTLTWTVVDENGAMATFPVTVTVLQNDWEWLFSVYL